MGQGGDLLHDVGVGAVDTPFPAPAGVAAVAGIAEDEGRLAALCRRGAEAVLLAEGPVCHGVVVFGVGTQPCEAEDVVGLFGI